MLGKPALVRQRPNAAAVDKPSARLYVAMIAMRTPLLCRALLSAIFLATPRCVVARDWVVDAAHDATDLVAADGTAAHPFRAIAPAAEAAQPGDVVLVRPGVYRERVAPARGGDAEHPIVYRAAEVGKAIVKGSDVLQTAWVADDEKLSIFRGKLDPTISHDGDNPFRRNTSVGPRDASTKVRPPAEGKPLEPVLGEIFVDGEPYDQVTTADALRKRERTWRVPADGDSIVVHFPAGKPPTDRLIEITTRDRIFAPHRRGLGFIHVEGFVFEHCANQGPFPQGGAVSVRSGHDWLIQHNTIRFAATIGLDCGGETWDVAKLPDTAPEERKLLLGGHHLIRDNDVSDNGLCGIAGWAARGTVIEDNRVERNNRRHFPLATGGWEEWAGIKLHATDSVIRHNLIRDNHAFGVWLDNGYPDARVDANVILRNVGAGVFCEFGGKPGHPALVTNNVIAGTTANGFYGGHGVYAHDASDVTVAHNLAFDNSGFGVMLRTVTDRVVEKKPAETSRDRIVANIFVNNDAGALSLPYPNPRSTDIFSDDNVFALSKPLTFSLNKYQSPYKLEDVYEQLRRVATDDALPDVQTWVKNPRLTLDQWRRLLKWDEHTTQADVAAQCDDRVLPPTLRLTLPASLPRVPASADKATDFFGRPLPEAAALPGPFQNLKPGENSIVLDPSRPPAP